MAKISVRSGGTDLSPDSTRIVTGATDDQMVYGLLVWASSLAQSAGSPFHLVVAFFEGTLANDNIDTIDAVLDALEVEHSFLPLTPDDRFHAQGHISPTTFTKFLIADALPQAHLWIDVDTTATEGWDELFAVVDQASSPHDLVVAERGDVKKLLISEGFAPSDLPFNAGVLGWPSTPRRDWSTALAKAGDVPTIEQYVFNVLYSPTCLRVPEAFNTLTYRFDSLATSETPKITHYAGAHKPWHLPRRYASVCTQHQCPWSLWFAAERALMASLGDTGLSRRVNDLAAKARRSGVLRFRRDHSGLWLLRLVDILGPLGWGIVLAAKPFARWIPRGTHPLH